MLTPPLLSPLAYLCFTRGRAVQKLSIVSLSLPSGSSFDGTDSSILLVITLEDDLRILCASSFFFYRQAKANAISSPNTTKQQPISRGTHHIERSPTSILGCAVLAQPRTPWGYSSDHVPKTTRQNSPTTKRHFSGASNMPKNVSTTRTLTVQSAILIN